MKLIHTSLFALLLGLFSGCSMLKAVKYMKSGSVNRPVFKIEVPFEMRLGLIILKVMIHGKEYSFILDTGAPDAISKELAQQLGVKVAGSGKISDSQGGNGTLGYTAIDSIGIGGLQFLNTGAIIADLRQSTDIACFNADGVIGTNLMRKAVWQIDYQRSQFAISSFKCPKHKVPPNTYGATADRCGAERAD
jgi:hypothetical protein